MTSCFLSVFFGTFWSLYYTVWEYLQLSSESFVFTVSNLAIRGKEYDKMYFYG